MLHACFILKFKTFPEGERREEGRSMSVVFLLSWHWVSGLRLVLSNLYSNDPPVSVTFPMILTPPTLLEKKVFLTLFYTTATQLCQTVWHFPTNLELRGLQKLVQANTKWTNLFCATPHAAALGHLVRWWVSYETPIDLHHQCLCWIRKKYVD